MPNPLVLATIAEVFSIEVKDLFGFSHLMPPEDLKQELIKLLEEPDDKELVLTYKYLRTFML